MSTQREIVGWLLIDGVASILVREKDGKVSAQALDGDDFPEAIQTGRFDRGELAAQLARELALEQ